MIKNYVMIIEKLVQDLINGELVCFPTETVYALACVTDNEDSIAKIYSIKKRSLKKPLCVMLPSTLKIYDLAEVNDENLRLIEKYLPGPFTFILPKKSNLIYSCITGYNTYSSLKTLGVRVPDHPISLEILKKVNKPIFATSINISGGKSTSRFCDIPESIMMHVSSAINDDSLVSGDESTIVDLSSKFPTVLRGKRNIF